MEEKMEARVLRYWGLGFRFWEVRWVTVRDPNHVACAIWAICWGM